VKKEQELIKKRKIPEWNGVNFIDNKNKDKRKENFHKEWKAHFQSFRISQAR
jgi:hypothetical protein